MMSDQVSDVASTSNAGDDGDDSDSDQPMSKANKTVHSMVEKKRRDKMAQYVTDLSTMIPMCGVMQRKLDKITVLRMAVQHVKAIKGSKVTPTSDRKLATPIANEEMMKAVLESADCFLFVIACDRGKFLYVSESVSRFINCHHSELIGQSIFDILHSKDLNKVKEQLIASDVTAREVFIDAKTMEPVNPGVVPKEELGISSPGAARSFFCRMKNRLQAEVVPKTEPDVMADQTKKKRPVHVYVSLHCTGFLKTWASSKVTAEADPNDVSCNLACLVAIARHAPQLSQNYIDSHGHINMKPIQFYAKLNNEYKISFVEPMVTYVTGFLPQEMIGNKVYEMFKNDCIPQLKDLLKMTTKTNEKIVSSVLEMKTINLQCICVRVVLSSFKNPFTSELEHYLLDVTAVPSYTRASAPPAFMDHESVPSGTVASSPVEDRRTHTYSTHSPQSDSLISGSEGDIDDPNNDASQAIIMSILEADGGLGGQLSGQNLSWLVSNNYNNQQ